MPDNECFPDPHGMSEDEKIELIDALHYSNHDLIEQHKVLVTAVSSLAFSMHTLAQQAVESNVCGKRTRTIDLLAMKLELISQIGLGTIGVSSEDVEQAEAFSAIVEGLEDDPQFQVPTTEEGES